LQKAIDAVGFVLTVVPIGLAVTAFCARRARLPLAPEIWLLAVCAIAVAIALMVLLAVAQACFRRLGWIPAEEKAAAPAFFYIEKPAAIEVASIVATAGVGELMSQQNSASAGVKVCGELPKHLVRPGAQGTWRVGK
jgi:hypothetical protein